MRCSEGNLTGKVRTKPHQMLLLVLSVCACKRTNDMLRNGAANPASQFSLLPNRQGQSGPCTRLSSNAHSVLSRSAKLVKVHKIAKGRLPGRRCNRYYKTHVFTRPLPLHAPACADQRSLGFFSSVISGVLQQGTHFVSPQTANTVSCVAEHIDRTL